MICHLHCEAEHGEQLLLQNSKGLYVATDSQLTYASLKSLT